MLQFLTVKNLIIGIEQQSIFIIEITRKNVLQQQGSISTCKSNKNATTLFCIIFIAFRTLVEQADKEKRVLLTQDAKVLRHDYLIKNQIYRLKNHLKKDQLIEVHKFHAKIVFWIYLRVICKLHHYTWG